ncbi:hypothetical protein [Streptomyces sp. NPDC001833]|uniref:hypothetical protein n=1 Tax=Streptomyces sp. NPDC001833 TaxID=3154658 RepID=UPI00332D8FCF
METPENAPDNTPGDSDWLRNLQRAVDATREGQRDGPVDPAWGPVGPALLLDDLARSMGASTRTSATLAGDRCPSLAERRAAVVNAARRLIEKTPVG